MNTIGAETLSVTSTTVPVVLTPASYAGKTEMDEVVITVEGGPVRLFCHEDASDDVTASVGHIAYDGDTISLEDDEIAHFACVKTTSTNGTLQVSYRR
jgi:hypothetical protein